MTLVFDMPSPLSETPPLTPPSTPAELTPPSTPLLTPAELTPTPDDHWRSYLVFIQSNMKLGANYPQGGEALCHDENVSRRLRELENQGHVHVVGPILRGQALYYQVAAKCSGLTNLEESKILFIQNYKPLQRPAANLLYRLLSLSKQTFSSTISRGLDQYGTGIGKFYDRHTEATEEAEYRALVLLNIFTYDLDVRTTFYPKYIDDHAQHSPDSVREKFRRTITSDDTTPSGTCEDSMGWFSWFKSCCEQITGDSMADGGETIKVVNILRKLLQSAKQNEEPQLNDTEVSIVARIVCADDGLYCKRIKRVHAGLP